MKQFSQACERNKEPILAILREAFDDRTAILEIGSGTGQHAVFFGTALPHLTWQPSDLEENLAGINAWLDEAKLASLHRPIVLDVDQEPWPRLTVDGVFTANTLHIVSWLRVQRLFSGVGTLLPSGGVFCTYGPFNYDGTFTSESNAQFDVWLKARDPLSGIRDFEALSDLGEEHGLRVTEDIAMPANNRILVWRKR